jgi:hypothetical protein
MQNKEQLFCKLKSCKIQIRGNATKIFGNIILVNAQAKKKNPNN